MFNLEIGVFIENGVIQSSTGVVHRQIGPHEVRAFLQQMGNRVLFGDVAQLARLLLIPQLHILSVNIPKKQFVSLEMIKLKYINNNWNLLEQIFEGRRLDIQHPDGFLWLWTRTGHVSEENCLQNRAFHCQEDFVGLDQLDWAKSGRRNQ